MAKRILVKDKNIKIFLLESKRNDKGFEIITKKYIHPLDSYLKAYFRTLSSFEINSNKQVQNDTTALFIINRRVITEDMFIERDRRTFGKETYQITSIDGYEDSSNDLKIGAKKIVAPSYDLVEGSDWYE